MPTKGQKFERVTQERNLNFLSIAIPLGTALWIANYLFYAFFNHRDFTSLPLNFREEYITSLFFRSSEWLFPFTLFNVGDIHVPLSLTDSIPLFALFYKIFQVNISQYFGAWIIFSLLLYTFFAYRICKNIFTTKNSFYIGLCTTIFLLIPFFWYHLLNVSWLCGIWTILWAYSLFFKRKSYTSPEWFGVIIFSSLIHPFLTFINFCIMISDIVHLYIYKHSISSVKAASTFSYLFTVCFLAQSFSGVFYLTSFQTEQMFPSEISFSTLLGNMYNASYIFVGYGILIGVIIAFILAGIYAKNLPKLLYYYRALTSILALFLLLSMLGGIKISPTIKFYIPLNWSIVKFSFTSGAKFLFPIFLLGPIIIASTAHQLEKKYKYLGGLFLISVIILQLFSHNNITPTYTYFVPLDKESTSFLLESKDLKWIFPDTNIPLRPPCYEKLAYFAFHNKKTINSIPLVRFPTGYRAQILNHTKEFLNKEFHSKSVYIIPKDNFPQEYFKLGNTHTIDNVILFKQYNENK